MAKNTETNDIGNRLKELREVLQLSRTEIAKKLGIVASTYARYEGGGSIPLFATFTKLASLYDVSLDWLMMGRGEMFHKEESPVDLQLNRNPNKTQLLEMITQMNRSPFLQHKVLTVFYQFKLDYKEPPEPQAGEDEPGSEE
ncbi:MAG: helix-turn-helix transcriptional regulator [bacterium]|nr:helix-turn-helix transcriptional regulator [bacterium]